MTDKIEITQENYAQILELANSSNSRTDLLKKLGWGKNSIRLRQLDNLLALNNFDYKNFPNINSQKTFTIIPEYTKEVLMKYVAESYSYSEVLRRFDKTKSGSSIKILIRYIKTYKIDTSHFDLNHKFYNPEYSTYKTDEEIFIENSFACTQTAKKRIIKNDLIEYKCHGKNCMIKESWLGNKITLQLEHKNGNNKDHRLENLEFLCPNCHSVTLTWGGRNIKNRKAHVKNEKFVRKFQLDKQNLLENILPLCNTTRDVIEKYGLLNQGGMYKGLEVILRENITHPNVIDFIKRKEVKLIKYPPIDELLEMVKEKGFSKAGRELNCSDNAIRAYLKRQKIDVKNIK